MKKLAAIIIIVLAVLFMISLAKDMIIKASVEKGVAIVTGLRLNIRSLNVGILKMLVGVRGLRLFNPESYRE